MKPLQSYIKNLISEGICIAFSGGVDSSLLLKIACMEAKTQNQPLYAITFDTALHPKTDLLHAKKLAEEFGALHIILSINELDNKIILQNPIDRCYHCKKYLFETLKDFANTHHLKHILDGTNFDDLHVYRPGLLALKELQIKSPLAELGITKNQVRQFAKELGLSVAKRPSAPCLATRIPYNTPLDFSLLQKIEQGEAILSEMGFSINRIRIHQNIARIEIEQNQFPLFLQKQSEILIALQVLDIPYITLDLEGFRSGSMDSHLSNSLPKIQKNSQIEIRKELPHEY